MERVKIANLLIFFMLLISLVLSPNDSNADMNRGLQNYQAIIKGEKKVDQLTSDELNEVMTIHRMMKGGGGSGEGCDAAHAKCVNSCESYTFYFDYESSEFLPLSNTDYISNCEDACSRGRNYCEGEEKDEMCYEFKRACSFDCPTSLFDYSSSEFKLLTDVTSKCEDACSDGERACD